LGDGQFPDNHPAKYDGDSYEQTGGLAEGCAYETTPSRGRFLSGKVALIAQGGCGYVNGGGFAAKARYAQRAGATAVVIMSSWGDAPGSYVINDLFGGSDSYHADLTNSWTHGNQGAQSGAARPRYYSPASYPWVDEIRIPVVHIWGVDGWALRTWLANGLDLIAFPIDSRTLGVRVAGTCGTVDIGGAPCLAHQVKHVNGEATCYTDCHKMTVYDYFSYQGSENTTVNGLTCESPCRINLPGVPSSNSPYWRRAWRGPWCFTNQAAGQWDYCGIPACTLMGTLHANVGSCDGVNNELTHPDGREWTWSECAKACLAAHPDTKAIDGPKHGSCHCHTTCPHLADCGGDDSMAIHGFELPTSCGPSN
jgi:hypothetical protein